MVDEDGPCLNSVRHGFVHYQLRTAGVRAASSPPRLAFFELWAAERPAARSQTPPTHWPTDEQWQWTCVARRRKDPLVAASLLEMRVREVELQAGLDALHQLQREAASGLIQRWWKRRLGTPSPLPRSGGAPPALVAVDDAPATEPALRQDVIIDWQFCEELLDTIEIEEKEGPSADTDALLAIHHPFLDAMVDSAALHNRDSQEALFYEAYNYLEHHVNGLEAAIAAFWLLQSHLHQLEQRVPKPPRHKRGKRKKKRSS